ncbi:MAG: rhodanese-like domain-containing protein [Planctomycetota bacterium]
MRPLAGALVLAVTSASPGQPAEVGGETGRCLECHGRPHIGELGPEDRHLMVVADPAADGRDAPATRPSLFIDYERVYGSSVHSDLTCVSCHVDCVELPHAAVTAPARCDACHVEEFAQHRTSVHGEGHARGARCSDCHGTHDIISSGNRQSRTHKLNLPFTCAECHTNPDLMTAEGVHQPLAAQQYIDSMHGRALIEKGLIVAPSCNDCHGVHNILPSTDPDSTIHRDHIPVTCGKCHIGIEQVYDQSIHGQLLAAGDERGPVCATCHTAHDIVTPGSTEFKLASDERCGQCHADRLERYRETFHGKAHALKLPGVAACYDCHGHHDIVPLSDPSSRLAGERRVETCRQCHPTAGPKFAGYIAHGDHTDRANYPILYWTFVFMTAIVIGTFLFFGVHTATWFLRSLALYVRDPEAFRHQKVRAARDEEQYVRFRPFDRFLHGLVVSSFLLLVATGMPLKFYYTGWAQTMVSLIGGLEVASALHRVGAIITFLYFALHLGSLFKAAIRNRAQFRDPKTGRLGLGRALKFAFGPEMPLPTLADVRQWWAHQKWFFGRGPRPDFDKWTYWEKFDYFAVFWGVAIIGLSGLVMWFPETTTRILPGWIINVALIVHSDEALLAAGFIFTFHFFNVHFRPEKFPMDPVIFSGRISKTEMLHERKLWYDRLVAEGKLDKVRVRDEWHHWKKVIHPMGYLAFGLGTLLLLLIFYAMGSRLFGGGH